MTTVPDLEEDLLEFVRTSLFTAVVGDVLDTLGRYHQFLPADIRAIGPDVTLAGRAMPVTIADEFEPPARPFGRLTEALDSLKKYDVYAARSGRNDCAAWGEILTATAKSRSAAGAVIDGFHRDTRRVLEQHWPVFSRGAYGQDGGARASVVDFRVSIEVGGVRIDPGDLVVGDADGVVVVPSAIEREVLERAIEKVSAEGITKRAIAMGMASTEAYSTYGVL